MMPVDYNNYVTLSQETSLTDCWRSVLETELAAGGPLGDYQFLSG